jgi:tetratricopeptide (TPR) repeat protein
MGFHRIIVLVTLWILFASTPVRADSKQDLADCGMAAQTGLTIRRATEACTRIIQTAKETPANLAWAYVRRVNLHLRMDSPNYPQALADSKRAIEISPRYAPAYVSSGLVYLEMKMYDAALGQLTKAIKIDPRIATAYSYRGVAKDALLDDGAREDHDMAVSLAPNDALILMRRGKFFMGEGEYDLSKKDFDAALRIDPTNARVYALRGWMYFDKKDSKNALIDLTKSIELGDTNSTEAFWHRARVHARDGRRHEAIADLDKQIEADPSEAKYYMYRGLQYGELGEHVIAIDDFNKAIGLDNNDETYYAARAIAYQQSGRAAAALTDIDTAIKMRAQRGFFWETRGRILEDLGRQSDAVESYKKALSLNPNLETSALALKRLGQ